MKNDMIKVPMEVELLDTTKEELVASGYSAVPFAEISSYGLVGSELLKMAETIKTPGGEGIYRVTFPKGACGTLGQFKDEKAFFGTISTGKGFGNQARLTPVSFSPEQVFMAIALMDISNKLQEILKSQKRIEELLFAKEEAIITGNFSALSEAIESYKYNWDQQIFVDQNLGLIGEIKLKMYESIDLYKHQIENILTIPNDLHRMNTAGEKVQELYRLVGNYCHAVYVLSYATFFETLLHRNFREKNLNNIKKTINNYAQEYRRVYKRSIKWAEDYLTSPLSYKIRPVLFALDDAYVQVIKLFRHDGGAFEVEREYYRPVEQQLEPFQQFKNIGTSVFLEKIENINTINNHRVDMYIDEENVYYLEDASV